MQDELFHGRAPEILELNTAGRGTCQPGSSTFGPSSTGGWFFPSPMPAGRTVRIAVRAGEETFFRLGTFCANMGRLRRCESAGTDVWYPVGEAPSASAAPGLICTECLPRVG